MTVPTPVDPTINSNPQTTDRASDAHRNEKEVRFNLALSCLALERQTADEAYLLSLLFPKAAWEPQGIRLPNQAQPLKPQ